MAFESEWDIVKNTLAEKYRLKDHQIYSVSDVRDKLRELASGGMRENPYFTLHNEIHSDNMISILGKLREHFTDDIMLSDYESYLLAISVYLHDVGMFFSKERYIKEIQPNFNDLLNFCNKCDNPIHYAEILEEESIGYQIRMVHHLLSAFLIDEPGMFPLKPKDKPHIITICRGHRKAKLNCTECDCYKVHPTKASNVRRGLLGSLLRLSDALDVYPGRAPEQTFITNAWDFLENPVALRHWLKHYFAETVHIAKNDRTGNKYLDCQIIYKIRADKFKNNQSYEDFFRPLFDAFLEEAREGDFNLNNYSPDLADIFDIQEITITYELFSERGGITLPPKIIKEIENSSCNNALEFIDFLKSERKNSTKIIKRPLMNRQEQTGMFESLLETLLDSENTPGKLMVIAGDSGQGKTELIKRFKEKADEQKILSIKIDLSEAIDPLEILDEISRKFGANYYHSYMAKREKKGQIEQRYLSKNIESILENIEYVVRRSNEDDLNCLLENVREEHFTFYDPANYIQEITTSFFHDWESIVSVPKIVIMFDTFEKTNPMMKRWIKNNFLEEFKTVKNAIVIISGQETPELSDYWEKYGYISPLKSVEYLDYWNYTKDRGVNISKEKVQILYKYLKGLPKPFVEFLEAETGG